MVRTCGICGKAIEAPGGRGERPPLDHACRESGYERDLFGLVALSQRRAEPELPETDVSLDAPPSVREAIRLADGPLPALPPPPSPEPPGRPRRRTALMALPVIAIVTAGVILGAARASHRTGRAASPLSTMNECVALPAMTEAITPPFTPVVSSAPPPPRAPEHASSPSAPDAPAQPAHPPPKLAVAPRPRQAPKASAAPSASAPPVAAPEPPSLMQAITEAVRTPRGAGRSAP